MVYKKQFVASIKCNSKILRERGEEVYLPFGSHFSILVKNLNNIACRAYIYIDGENVLGNFGILLEPGQTDEIERFITNQNLNNGNKFKFIEKTGIIEEYRGNRIEDSLIHIEYQFEKVQDKIKPEVHIHYHPIYGPYSHPYPNILGGPYLRGPYLYPPSNIHSSDVQGVSYSKEMSDTSSINQTSRGGSSTTLSVNSASMQGVTSSVGITVPGELSNQEFQISNKYRNFNTEKEVIIFKLVGEVDNIEVKKPLTIKKSLECQTCGKKNKSSDKFCSRCGTSTQIV
jgi:hypothetical protein